MALQSLVKKVVGPGLDFMINAL